MNIVSRHWFYLVFLLVGVCGLFFADAKYKLVFFYHAKAAIKTILILITILLLADIAGIKLDIFFTNQRYVTGLHIISPNLPIEELVFLFLLSYVTLIVYRLISLQQKGSNV